MRTLVLDAMGVIYKASDDVAEMLIPFVHSHGGVSDPNAIEELYMQASRGEISSAQFWSDVGIDSALEDEFLSGHELRAGLMEFLPQAREVFQDIYCLSNDVSEWSLRLRKRFGLEQHISQWFISGDMHLRKPDPAIYLRMLESAHLKPADVVFVDDRPKNLLPARDLGITAVLTNPVPGQDPRGLPIACTLSDILVFSSGNS